jgi:hypothetical protein
MPPDYMIFMPWFAEGRSAERLAAAKTFFAEPALHCRGPLKGEEVRMSRLRTTAAACVIAAAATMAPAAEVGFQGWGPRVGASSDADQVLLGAQFDLGEFTTNLRWQPSFELGFGDDKLSLYGNFMVSYYFPVKAAVTPYAGAQVTVWLFDQDGPNNDGFDDGFNAEIGLYAVGGIETKLKGNNRFLAELQAGIGDVPDIRVLVGWTFK